MAYSAIPTFVATSNVNYISLVGNVTSSTLAAGANGQVIDIVICQDATGSRTFVWPTTVRGGGTIGGMGFDLQCAAFHVCRRALEVDQRGGRYKQACKNSLSRLLSPRWLAGLFYWIGHRGKQRQSRGWGEG